MSASGYRRPDVKLAGLERMVVQLAKALEKHRDCGAGHFTHRDSIFGDKEAREVIKETGAALAALDKLEVRDG